MAIFQIKSLAAASLLLAGAACFAQSNPEAHPREAQTEQRQAAFATHRQAISAALSAASQCVAGAQDNKSIRQCIEKLHASMPAKSPAAPSKNQPATPKAAK